MSRTSSQNNAPKKRSRKEEEEIETEMEVLSNDNV